MLNLPEKQRLEFIACIFSKCGKEWKVDKIKKMQKL
jgi:hypothetical protein